MNQSNNLLLYEINVPVYLSRLSESLKRPAVLSDMTDEEIDRLKGLGVSHLWLMGIWQRSPAARLITLNDENFMNKTRELIADMSEEDVIGSAYSVGGYEVDEMFGGEKSLISLRKRLEEKGIKLVLDFVPNHTAPDNAWALEHPEYYIQGTKEELANHPNKFLEIGDHIYANGRDPTLEPWGDVIQLNAFSEAYRQEAVKTLLDISKYSDGVRCDMAMLLMTEVFENTWEGKAGPRPDTEFWLEVIKKVREQKPDFIFIAECYWDTEATLLEQGFSFCYDKVLYDHLAQGLSSKVKEHINNTTGYRSRLLTFIENHDELRAASVFSFNKELAATAIAMALPGMSMVHDGQMEGFESRIPVHLKRGRQEQPIGSHIDAYSKIMNAFKLWDKGQNSWELLSSASEEVVAILYKSSENLRLAVINYDSGPTKTNLSIAGDLSRDIVYFTDMLGNHQLAVESKDNGFQIVLELQPWQILLLSSNN